MGSGRHRVHYYSPQDLASSYNLSKAKKILDGDIQPPPIIGINDALELYNIKLYFDDRQYPDVSSEEQLRQYQVKVKQYFKEVKGCLSQINDDSIKECFESVQVSYAYSFWDLFSHLKMYKKVSTESLTSLATTPHFNITHLLGHKDLVKHYPEFIKNHLLSDVSSAELLLTQFEQHKGSKSEFYLPVNLSDQDKIAIIENYLESPDPNLNYIRLIASAKTLKLPIRLKLKAKRMADSLNDKLLEEGCPINFEIELSVVKEQVEPLKIMFDKDSTRYTYQYAEWAILDACSDPTKLFLSFRWLLKYTNAQGCIEHVRKTQEIDPFMDSFMRSKYEYFVYPELLLKMKLSVLQLLMIDHLLQNNDDNIEHALTEILTNVFRDDLAVDGLELNLPPHSSNALEKIRMLTPEIESLVKQYQSYVEEGAINFDLIRFSNEDLDLGRVPSRRERKYAYAVGDDVKRVMYYFFSSDSLLYPASMDGRNAPSLYAYLQTYESNRHDLEPFQCQGIDYLVAHNHLTIESDGSITIVKPHMITLLAILYRQEVLSYWHFDGSARMLIDELERLGYVEFEDTLLTREEVRYFNYYLNKRDFNNGLNLRNKYLHGTNSSNPDEHRYDYYRLIKVLILILLKIEDDLLLTKELDQP